MKKTALLITILVLMCSLTSCTKNTTDFEKEEASVGKYHYEIAYGESSVIKFLNELDEKYEVLSITYAAGGFYRIFYKDVE